LNERQSPSYRACKDDVTTNELARKEDAHDGTNLQGEQAMPFGRIFFLTLGS
jgi:hypothetical protein